MKHLFKIVPIALIFLVVSCANERKAKITENAEAISVELSTVEAVNANPFITASGKIEAVNSANISTRMMGFVEKIYVNVGDKVKKGQLLISINNTDLQAKLAQAKASITEAQAAYNSAQKDFIRFKNLFEANSATQKEMDDMRANFEMAEARLEAAQQMKNEVDAQLSYVNILAPFNGVVTNKFIETGDMANPGVPLIALESPKGFQVTAMVPESDISKINTGSEVSVIIQSIDKKVKGKVTEASTSAKHTGGQYLVKVILTDTEANLLSGMYATVRFPVEKSTTSSVVLIPTEAIINRGQLTGIYTVSQRNTALLRWLRLGRTYGDKVEVLSGLTSDETYIVSAQGKLYNGAKISIQ